ncbi:hypothetical protein [Hymenobacter cellulosilyticus]|uniref:Uncharacterized protein n=1 Tax=Hymenobacter cellulosilyticus TaxID=2932248 RepID=A0A8T9QC38_9BACT|nr:hypothetical protein [Hymenobacter cellulosilyticus]UOQ75164.1 hypothetical protein MUN79_28665 [Hymenobacter cellulosilyticus]
MVDLALVRLWGQLVGAVRWRWTSQHQMSVNGKHDGFTRADLKAVAREMNIHGADDLVAEVLA